MRLPDGVTHLPNRAILCAIDKDAVLRIASAVSGNANYDINDRTFAGAVDPYLRGDWLTFHLKFPLVAGGVTYSGAEHNGIPKQPNLTVVPNLLVTDAHDAPDADPPRFVLGCTMGHQHPDRGSGPWVQEMYEFQSYGLLVLQTDVEPPEIWVAKDGDKVAVPNGCYMTLYNLGDEHNPLITLDFADPGRNPSNKRVVGEFGPVLLAYYSDREVVFTLNETYAGWPGNALQVRLSRDLRGIEDRTITIRREGRLNLGAFLYEQLTQDPDTIANFARIGFRIRRASPECVLDPLPAPTPTSGPRGSRLCVSRPLAEAMTPGNEAFGYFFPGATSADKPSNDVAGFVDGERQMFAERQQNIAPTKRLTEVVFLLEGAGEWVEKAYRPVFLKLVNAGRNIRVFYADDTRWRQAPIWTKTLEPWETYLDKADPLVQSRYQNLRPDAVIVVTPDFTHSDLAQQWVNSAIPLILVEKPFDALLSNVERLFDALARKQAMSAVRGIDHYQFRALQLHRKIGDVAAHLGGPPRQIRFFMTETRPLESSRLRTLQYGLTLDMLPHLLALLAGFGDIFTIDEVEVLEAGQYTGTTDAQKGDLLRFPNETYSAVRMTFEPFGSTGRRIRVIAVVGKGFGKEVKCLDVDGTDGKRVRLDFRRTPVPGASYPLGSLLFMHPQPGATTFTTTDIYNNTKIHLDNQGPLEDPELFYKQLILDIADGSNGCLGNTLLPGEAWQVVKVLDCIWRAIQDYHRRRGGWITWPLGTKDPITLL